MLLTRKTTLVAAILAALLGPLPLAAWPGPVGHRLVPEVAILPTRTRARRLIRFARVRVVTSRLLGRARRTAAAIEARERRLRPRLVVRDCLARGPPRLARAARAGHLARTALRPTATRTAPPAPPTPTP
jgi:hypothetical protein